MSYEWRPKAFVQCLAGAVLIRSHPRARQLASALPRLSICTTGVAIAPGIYHCTNAHSRTCAGPASFEAGDAVGFRIKRRGSRADFSTTIGLRARKTFSI